MAKRKGLGKGLNELGVQELLSRISAPAALDEQTSSEAMSVHRLPVETIHPGIFQPRLDFDEIALADLAESIKAYGVIQPILVRPKADGSYEIIAGERRWRAAQLAGLETIPVVIQQIPDDAALAIGLIENIQREDLNVVEQAEGLNRLLKEFEFTHQQLATLVGKSRSNVTNLLRLLQLNGPVRHLLESGQLDMGHARCLLSLESMEAREQAAQAIVQRDLSVRAAEQLVKRMLQQVQQNPTRTSVAVPKDVTEKVKRLSQSWGVSAQTRAKSKGRQVVELQFDSIEQLEAWLSLHVQS